VLPDTTFDALQIWGRDDDGGGLTFRQQDVEKLVQLTDHRSDFFALFPMKADHGRVILNLAVSDLNKVRQIPS
jgi:hypothetical protein